jgi:glutamate--cysteine ligase
MINKFRAGLALQPVCIIFIHCFFSICNDFVRIMYLIFLSFFSLCILQIATAIFANSPFKEGKPNGFLSLRRYH